ncbi:1-phosphatidylinositol-4-phosphate 5-kinase [Coprinopsis sp. MPI-PUGE-AT-0042]|nr:1-phosphatidylinositol-4-phosphate 5-kinase [Coprinopsis sp. MPI-PUGE-AT-0042]
MTETIRASPIPAVVRSPSPMSVTSLYRQSLLPATPSTAASFKTAASPTASVHTITSPTTKEDTVFTAMSSNSTADVHMVAVTREDTVDGSHSKPPLRLEDPTAYVAGPPPPSPPASVEEPVLAPEASTSQTLGTTVTRQRSGSSLFPPPTPSFAHPARRNTTGSAAGRSGSKRSKALGFDDSASPDPPTSLGGALASDIEHHAEQIRRERQEKRYKQQQKEAEDALTRTASKASKDEERPVVGNLIGEDHANYVLMYNMLTGIRTAVSRCQAKMVRTLSDADFTAAHKYSFDIVGNELTPSAKYDFKFKDYAPWVFRTLREDHFALDPADYLLSLTAKYILSELGSPGKSGSFFYFSRDYRFIIKTIRHSEHKFLLRILKQYYEHVRDNPHTLLSRFYGLHRVKLPRGRKIHFVIMNNLFPPHKDVHETFDLKGSTVGREYPEDKAAQNPRAVLKDLNWINRGKMLELGPEKQALLVEQIKRDAEFLKTVYVMDYSLLVGIHNMQRGNKDNLRRNTLKIFSPELPRSERSKSLAVKAGTKTPEAIAIRRAMRSSDPKRLAHDSSIQLPEVDSENKQLFIFYQDEGGMRATDENNDPLPTIYYLGIIDILTPYNTAKKAEHIWKGMKDDRHKISPVPPAEYGDRFFNFMKAIMKGGEGGEKFV